jgi:uncharacterized protein (TIGR03435 family)
MFAQPAKFEVASLRASPPEAQCGMIQAMPGGGLKVECLSLSFLVAYAYDVQTDQISGGPAWIESKRWNILAKPNPGEARPDGPAAYEQMNDEQRRVHASLAKHRLRALLEERFKLILNKEIQQRTVYALEIGKRGPHLKEATGGTGPVLLRLRGEIRGNGASTSGLAQYLGSELRSPVVDKTGLAGRYEFNLKWALDGHTNGAEPSEELGPSLFTAIQEQLGLRLVAGKGPVEILVVQSAEMPPEN